MSICYVISSFLYRSLLVSVPVADLATVGKGAGVADYRRWRMYAVIPYQIKQKAGDRGIPFCPFSVLATVLPCREAVPLNPARRSGGAL